MFTIKNLTRDISPDSNQCFNIHNHDITVLHNLLFHASLIRLHQADPFQRVSRSPFVLPNFFREINLQKLEEFFIHIA